MYISLNCDKDRHVQVKFKYFAALVQTMQRWQQDEEKEKREQCDRRQEISPPCQPQQGLVVQWLEDLASQYQIEKELRAKPGCCMLMASCKASGDRFLVTERTKPPPSVPTALDPLGDPPVLLEVCCMIRLLGVPRGSANMRMARNKGLPLHGRKMGRRYSQPEDRPARGKGGVDHGLDKGHFPITGANSLWHFQP